VSWPPIVELRQYTLHPGKRDVLIELFDRELVESQEALGMTVLGQFRDVDDPDRFVWLRGFRDMTNRAEGLSAFYGGPVWQRHREAANATMIDSDNVLLLRWDRRPRVCHRCSPARLPARVGTGQGS
jgi:NIPSNAP